MGLFGQSTPFDVDIEKATSDTNTNENWSLILDVCDKVSTNPRSAKDCLKAIMKRMSHPDPHVVMQAITLLDACASNCGKPFHLEIASRDFENEFRRLLSKAQSKVSLKMRQVIKNWAENDFKTDPELNLIPSLYIKLRHEGFDFANLNEKPPKSAAKSAAVKDPNVVSSQQEEEDIAKAIELSLKEAKNSPKNQGSGPAINTNTSTAFSSLYPSFAGSGSMASITSTGGASNTSLTSQPEPRKVRALYDFEAAEENELTFFSGEIIHVVDDSDPNWWKGYNQRGEGLFPSNFVTADLSVDPERLDINQQNKSKKNVQFEEDARELQQKTEAAAVAAANQRIEIDETKIDRLLHLLHEANPEDPSQDSEEMLRLEQEVHQMGPLIDAELERVDRKHAQLTQLSSDLVDAINLYHSLMRDDRAAMMGGGGTSFMSGMPANVPATMSAMGYHAATNSQVMYGAAGFPGAGATYLPQQANVPQNYGMMPYVNSGQLPGTAAPTQPGGAYSNNSPMQLGNSAQPQGHMPIPMQFQNGHMNSPQMNGGMNVLPQQIGSPVVAGQSQQQPQLYGGPLPQPQPQTQQQPQAQLQLQPQQQQLQPNYHMLAQQQQQQQQPPQPYPQQIQATPSPALPATVAHEQSSAPAAPPHQQYMSPQHQQPQAAFMQHPQQQFTAMPNGSQTYMVPPPSTVGGVIMQAPLPATASGANNPNNNNGNHPDQFSQLQQQIAAMSMAGINQPVTQNFLVQNEAKNNIPIYQQQR